MIFFLPLLTPFTLLLMTLLSISPFSLIHRGHLLVVSMSVMLG